MRSRSNRMVNSDIPPKNTKLHVVKLRHGTALVTAAITGAGLLLTIALLGLDVYYSYLPLIPVTNAFLAWVMAGITTPIEVAGAYLLGTKEQRNDLTKWALWFWYGIVIAGFVYDIATNIGGLRDDAVGRTAHMDVLVWCFILAGGFLMAFVEYLLSGMLGVFLAHVAEYQATEVWLNKWEQDHGYNGDMPPRPNMADITKRSRGMPMYTQTGDSMPRRPRSPARRERDPSRAMYEDYLG